MAIQVIMDRSGDSRHYFDPRDSEAVAKAERRFKQLTGRGFTAAARTSNGDSRQLRSFDPAVEETLFFPRLVGG
jgi:hypothetical protein